MNFEDLEPGSHIKGRNCKDSPSTIAQQALNP